MIRHAIRIKNEIFSKSENHAKSDQIEIQPNGLKHWAKVNFEKCQKVLSNLTHLLGRFLKLKINGGRH